MIATNQQSQTWSESFLMPLAQNIIGGMAVSGIAATGAYLLATTNVETVQNIAIISGILTTCGFTIFRFFGGDLGLLRHAYRQGQQSMIPQINRLQNQLHDADEQLRLAHEQGESVPANKNHQQILQAASDAESIIKWYFSGRGISRADCAQRGIKQRRWERAKQALANANIYDGSWHCETLQTALGRLQAHYNDRARRSIADNVVTPY